MTREVAHYKMFEATLDSISNNFPPGVLAANPRFTQQYFNLSDGGVRWPRNEDKMPGMDKDWIFVEKPIEQVNDTLGQTELPDDYERSLWTKIRWTNK
jgi:Mn-containing catalase